MQTIDLLGLAGVQLTKVSNTGGGEYAGPCPGCGGTDRFRVQPAQGRWMCRQCRDGRWSDAAGFLMWRDGIGFLEAQAKLEGRLWIPSASSRRMPAPPITQQPQAPSSSWRAIAHRVLERAELELRAEGGERARAWLAARGIHSGIVQARRLGYVRRPGYKIEGLWVAPGILIPGFDVAGVLSYVKIRKAVGRPKYSMLAGGHPCAFFAARCSRQILLVVEGEFDSMLAADQIGYMVDVVTFGSASSRATAADLSAWPSVVVALDDDAAGRSGASRVRSMSERVRTIEGPQPGGDITDAWLAGVDLARWFTGAVYRAGLKLEAPILQLDAMTEEGETHDINL